jgi:DNA-binding response OmpR family regulator
MARVLVVDDEADIVELVTMILERDGHKCVAADCGRKALEVAGWCEPHVVILDIGLPDITGYDVARALRALPGGNDIYIAALTGWGKEEDRRLAREAGIDRHLVKPTTAAMIREVLIDATLWRMNQR